MTLVLQGFLFKTRGPFLPFDEFKEEIGISVSPIRIPLKGRDSFLEAKLVEGLVNVIIEFGEDRFERSLSEGESFHYKKENGLVGMEMEVRFVA
ncbi:MAG: hypothetical protein K6B65_03420 [Bacilli bacterium]|nr:hypothetical protein [Bacilli bacterium]